MRPGSVFSGLAIGLSVAGAGLADTCARFAAAGVSPMVMSDLVDEVSKDHDAARPAECSDVSSLPVHHACVWTYPDINSAEAVVMYDALRAELDACFSAQEDVGVNHPDSYRAATYQTGTQRVTLSEKVKSQLGTTLLTVRFYALNN